MHEQCVQCSKAIENSQHTGVLCAACYAVESAPRADTSGKVSMGGALGLAVASWFLSARTTQSSSVTINGEQRSSTTEKSADFLGLPVSGLALVLGVFTLVTALRGEKKNVVRALVALAAIALAGWRLFDSLPSHAS